MRSFIRKQRNLDVVLAEVSAFDLAGRRVLLSDGRALHYDQLLVATGAGHSYEAASAKSATRCRGAPSAPGTFGRGLSSRGDY